MLKYSSFNSVRDIDPKLSEIDWPELAKKLTEFQIVPAKTGVGLFALASFTGSRSAENVENVYLLTLDFDNEKEIEELDAEGNPTGNKIKVRIDNPVYPELVESQLHGYAYAIASSFRNTPDHPKFRATIPLVSPVAGSLWKQIVNGLLGKLGFLDPVFFEGIDKLYNRPAQIYYWPSAPSEEHTYSRIGQGIYLSVPVDSSAAHAPRITGKKKKDVRFTSTQISRYFADRYPELPQTGEDWRGDCIIHGGTREDSLSISASTGLWNCFACSKGGDIYQFEKELNNISFIEAKRNVDDFLEVDDGVLPGAENLVTTRKEIESISTETEITPEIITKIAAQSLEPRRELTVQLIQQTQINPEQLEAEIDAVRGGLKDNLLQFPKGVTEQKEQREEEQKEQAREENNQETASTWNLPSIPGDRYVLDAKGNGIYPVKKTAKGGTETQFLSPVSEKLIWISEMADDRSSDTVFAKLNWLTSNMKVRSQWIKDHQTNSRDFLTTLDDAPLSSEIGGVSKWLAYQKGFLPKEHLQATSRLGWVQDQFVLDEESAGLLYMGKPIPRMGELEAWFEGLDILLAAAPTSLGVWTTLGLSVAAPLVRFVSHRNPVVGLIAETSSGKSISISYALSIWTNPLRSTIPAGSTWKGVQDHTKELSDIPVFLDELQQALKKNQRELEETIYFCGNGQLRITSQKTQMSKGGDKHHGVALYAAEQRVIAQTQLGAQVRTIEIVGNPMPDATIANAIQDIASENYGQVGLVIAALINDMKDFYIDLAKQYRQDFEQTHPGTRGTDSHVLGLMKVGLEMLSQISGRSIDAHSLTVSLADYIESQRASMVDTPTRLWSLIIDTVLSAGWANQDILGDLEGNVAYKGRELIDPDVSLLEINPTAPMIQRILTSLNENEKMADEFARRGWIIPSTDRNKFKRSGSKSGAGSRTWRVTQKGVEITGGM